MSIDGRPVRSGSGRAIAIDGALNLRGMGAADVLVLPGWFAATEASSERLLARDETRRTIDALARAASRGVLHAASCSATFALASTGVLDGQSAATAWWFGPAFARRFPAVQKAERFIIENLDRQITLDALARAAVPSLHAPWRGACGLCRRRGVPASVSPFHRPLAAWAVRYVMIRNSSRRRFTTIATIGTAAASLRWPSAVTMQAEELADPSAADRSGKALFNNEDAPEVNPPADDPGLKLRLIRSATITLSWNDVTLLVDPWLAPRGGGRSYAGTLTSPLVDLPLPIPELLAKVDGVFVSHLHSDHFDDTARECLPRDLPLLCPASLVPRFEYWGFSAIMPIESALEWNGATLTLTGGRHGSDEVLVEMGEVYGFLWKRNGAPTLYWVGDSIWCPEVETVLRRERPDVVVAHACGATWRGKGPLVMDAAHVEALLRTDSHCSVVAVHLDAVDHATVSRADLVRHFAPLPDLAARLHIPADGETLTFPPR